MIIKFSKICFLWGLALATVSVSFAQPILQIMVDDHQTQQHLSYRAIDVENMTDEPQVLKMVSAGLNPENFRSFIQFCDQNAGCEKAYLNTCQAGVTLASRQHCTIWLRAIPQDPIIPDTRGQIQLQVTTQNELVPPDATTFNINYSQDVYAGGSFDSPSLNIARWNGAQWQSLSTGLVGGEVMQLANYQGDLYAAGSFYQAGDEAVNFIAKWNGERWQNVGEGIGDPGADALAVYKNNLLVGGGFDRAGEQSANYLAKWNESNWFGYELGMDAPINALIADPERIYLGGEFTQLDNQSAAHIATEHNGRWQPLGTGVNNSVRSLALNPEGALIVGGLFDQAGGAPAAHIAKWEHNMWFLLGDGVNNNVLAVATDHEQVFAGGAFTQAGDIPVNFVAEWDGNKWSALADGVTFAKQPKYTQVYALTMHGQKLYVGGYFTQAHNKQGDINANYIAMWDRNQMQWQALGEGVNGVVRSIMIMPALKITHSQLVK